MNYKFYSSIALTPSYLAVKLSNRLGLGFFLTSILLGYDNM